jgi:four helix bundle protein
LQINAESTGKQMKIKDYKDLQIWQKGIEIVDKIYTITDSFPKSELYGLTSQMKKASISIPSNIAEGFARTHSKEYKQFLSIALGSCAELDTQLIIANRRSYIKKNDFEELADQINHESRMISSLINKL